MGTADLIRQARERAGLDQRSLATRGGCSQSALSSYERGTTSPTVATLERLLETCGLQVRWELEPLWADADEALDRPLPPLGERVRRALQVPEWLGELTADLERRGVPTALAGAVAAAVHGLPVEATRCELWLPDDDAALEQALEALDTARGHAQDYGLQVEEWSPAWLRALPVTRWWLRRTIHLDLRVVPRERLRRTGRTAVPACLDPEAVVDLPVLPLDALVLLEPAAARLLQRLLDRRAAGVPDAPVADPTPPPPPRVFL